MPPRLLPAALLALALAAPAGAADLKLHALFSDHMVLQRDKPVTVAGTAGAGQTVGVSIKGEGGVNVLDAATADAKGAFSLTLPAMKAGTGLTLSVRAGETSVEFKDVAVGDVWLCSGQSNMEWKLSGLPKDDQGKTIAAAAANPNIRFFDVPNRVATTPQANITPQGNSGKWLVASPETAFNFSAVGYIFGREIEKSQKVPVGLISSDWGGTPVEAWTSREGFAIDKSLSVWPEKLDATVKQVEDPAAAKEYAAKLEAYKLAAEKAKAEKKPAPRAPAKPGVDSHTPTVLYNGMIAPLTKFPIKGAVWYQGESNAGMAKSYRVMYPAMISDWRKQWGEELPFFAVQLAPFGNGNAARVEYAELRDAQVYATKALKNVGVAVITDSGDLNDIHPQRKVPAGERLALAARAITYGEKIVYSGPTYKSHAIDGNKVTITFDNVGAGLEVKGDTLAGFTLCGDDKVFRPASAVVEGNTVVVTSPQVPKPLAARFGWVNFAAPELNLFNKDGLPAVPFRTDDFPLTTK